MQSIKEGIFNINVFFDISPDFNVNVGLRNEESQFWGKSFIISKLFQNYEILHVLKVNVVSEQKIPSLFSIVKIYSI